MFSNRLGPSPDPSMILRMKAACSTTLWRCCQAISADKTRAVKLNLSKDKLTLTVINPDSGTATEDVGATYSAGAIEIGFNARYLLDITGQIEGKQIRFLLSDAGSPTIIEDTDDNRSLYVLMPMRV